MERRNFEVPRGHAGEAVALILHDGLGVAHSAAKGLIDEGCVTINGRPARRHGQRCAEGDVIEVRFDPHRRYRPLPGTREAPGFRIVHEDREIVVVDKLPGVLSSPAPGAREESLAERIAGSLRERGIKKPAVFVVHRLDRHTSGLLVFAKSQRALESLMVQFESREAGRIYAAVVEGRVAKERGTIISHLAEDPRTLSVRTTPLRGAGKRAVTHFEVVERLGAASLVRVRLETGRKHQIRIHFAEIGHPVVGDRRYGHGSALIQRVALHAEKLVFKHPRTLDRRTYDAPCPDDLTRLIHKLRKGAGGEELRAAPGGLARRSNGGEMPGPKVPVFPRGLVLLEGLQPSPQVEGAHRSSERPLAPRARRDATARGGDPQRTPGERAPRAPMEGARETGSRLPESRIRAGTADPGKGARLARERAVGSKPHLNQPRFRASAGPVTRHPPRGAVQERGGDKTREKSDTTKERRQQKARDQRGNRAAVREKESAGGIRPKRDGLDGLNGLKRMSAPIAPTRKPWEFKQKGRTLRRQKRQQIAAARAKTKKP